MRLPLEKTSTCSAVAVSLTFHIVPFALSSTRQLILFSFSYDPGQHSCRCPHSSFVPSPRRPYGFLGRSHRDPCSRERYSRSRGSCLVFRLGCKPRDRCSRNERDSRTPRQTSSRDRCPRQSLCSSYCERSCCRRRRGYLAGRECEAMGMGTFDHSGRHSLLERSSHRTKH